MEIITHLNFALLLTILLFLPATLASKEASNIAKPGCLTKCGDLTVPYPFGIISLNTTCSINPFFDINCDSSFDPPKAFLGSDKLEVLDIQDTAIRVKNRLATICFDKDLNMTQDDNLTMDLSGTPFTFSTENMLTVVGCDDLAIITRGASEPYNFLFSCMAFCSKAQDLINGSCSGIGCCQSSLERDLQYIQVFMGNLSSHSQVRSFNPCGYSFLAEESSYSFLISDLSDSSFVNRTVESVPILIDWAIGDQICDDQNHVCEGKSVCVDSGRTNGGYRCNCSEGHQGNPYLSPGCQDINECESYPCHPKGICVNLHGSYKCTCPPGYVGDGAVLGTGCISVSAPTKTVLYAGLLVGLGLILLLGFSYFLYNMLKKRRIEQLKHKHFKRNGGLLLLQQQTAHDSVLDKMRIFTSKELEKATDQFNASRILGQGGQGTVYKGMLSDGRIVAVKKSKQVNEGQLAEFINEVVILSQVNHRNVVRLLGCCLETQVPLLVYEFIPNGTLYGLIHDDNIDFPFKWDVRLRIASEIANALAYLHYATPVPIYHRDMKSNNIILDEKYRAKLADFGISRLVAIEQTHLTTKVKGTFGYLDPEYFQTSKFTEKSDVYSFGVVLVELLTGRKPVSISETEDLEEKSLVMQFLVAMEENCLQTILDSKIVEEGVSEEHIAVANLAKRCLSLSGKKRPTVREVASELENIRTFSETSFVDTSSETNSIVLSAEVYYQWAQTFV